VLLEPEPVESGVVIGEKDIIFAKTEASYLLRDLFSNKARVIKGSDSINIEYGPGDKVVFLRFNGHEIVLLNGQNREQKFLIVPAQDIICRIEEN
jgi:co-chaperonin GroES (HSP10)